MGAIKMATGGLPCLTKKGLAAGFRERIAAGTTRRHELSMQNMKRNRDSKRNATTNLTWWCSHDKASALIQDSRGSKPRSAKVPQQAVKHLSACPLQQVIKPLKADSLQPPHLTGLPTGSDVVDHSLLGGQGNSSMQPRAELRQSESLQ